MKSFERYSKIFLNVFFYIIQEKKLRSIICINVIVIYWYNLIHITLHVSIVTTTNEKKLKIDINQININKHVHKRFYTDKISRQSKGKTTQLP